VVIDIREGRGAIERGLEVVNDPLCNALRSEFLGTFSDELVGIQHLARVQVGDSGWCAAEILRADGEAILKRGEGDAAMAAEEMFQRSLDIARQQEALSWELRTATSLATLWRHQGRVRPAHELLASTYARFTEGFDTVDLLRAEHILKSLSAIQREGRRSAYVAITERRASSSPSGGGATSL
jgi:hypothetical protein